MQGCLTGDVLYRPWIACTDPSIESHWPIAANCHPVHHPAVPVDLSEEVGHGSMQAYPVVPYRYRTRRPSEAAGELRPQRVTAKEIEERSALFVGHALEAPGESRTHEKGLATGGGVGAHHRV